MHEFDKCIIFTKDNLRFVEGFVHEYDKGVMKIYTQGESNSFIVPEMEVYINVYNCVKGECKYVGTVNRASFNNIEIGNISLISSLQKRDNTRVSKQLKYRFSHYFEGGEKRRFDKPVDITILNISAQGIFLYCDRKFETGFRFTLLFRETPKPISLLVEVVRREEFPGSFNYGCKFVDISEKDMDEIFRFVLKEQIAQRRKNLMF